MKNNEHQVILVDKLNQTENEENEDLSVDTKDKKWFNSFVS